MGMSLVVRRVGAAMFVPALAPMYGSPPRTAVRSASRSPVRYSALSSRKELPPPTNTASASASATSGSPLSCTPRTVMPDGSSAPRTRAVYASWSANA